MFLNAFAKRVVYRQVVQTTITTSSLVGRLIIPAATITFLVTAIAKYLIKRSKNKVAITNTPKSKDPLKLRFAKLMARTGARFVDRNLK